MSLTVGQLKKRLKGIKDSTPVYIADGDHANWETAGAARACSLMNQKDLDDYEKNFLRENPEFNIKGDYIVIKS